MHYGRALWASLLSLLPPWDTLKEGKNEGGKGIDRASEQELEIRRQKSGFYSARCPSSCLIHGDCMVVLLTLPHWWQNKVLLDGLHLLATNTAEINKEKMAYCHCGALFKILVFRYYWIYKNELGHYRGVRVFCGPLPQPAPLKSWKLANIVPPCAHRTQDGSDQQLSFPSTPHMWNIFMCCY